MWVGDSNERSTDKASHQVHHDIGHGHPHARRVQRRGPRGVVLAVRNRGVLQRNASSNAIFLQSSTGWQGQKRRGGIRMYVCRRIELQQYIPVVEQALSVRCAAPQERPACSCEGAPPPRRSVSASAWQAERGQRANRSHQIELKNIQGYSRDDERKQGGASKPRDSADTASNTFQGLALGASSLNIKSDQREKTPTNKTHAYTLMIASSHCRDRDRPSSRPHL